MNSKTKHVVKGNKKVCSFFGHRKIKITQELIVKLKTTIEDLILKENVSIFLFGSNSEFNDLCHKVVTELRQKYTFITRVMYTCKSESCIMENERGKLEEIYSKYFNSPVHLLGFEEEYEHKTKYVSGKASYIERNYAMIDDSKYCIFYYDKNYLPPLRKQSKKSVGLYQPQSGTSLAYKYAKQKNKVVFNLF